MAFSKKNLKKEISELLQGMDKHGIKAYLESMGGVTKDDLQLLIDMGKTEAVLFYLTGYDLNYTLDFKTWFVPTEEEFKEQEKEHDLLYFNCFIDYLKGNDPNSQFEEYNKVNERTRQLIAGIINGEYDEILNLKCTWRAMNSKR